MKKFAKQLLVFMAVVAMILPANVVKADDDDDRAERVVKIVSSKDTIRVGMEFELEAITSPDDDDDNLRWTIIGKKGIIHFDDDDRDDDEAEFKALKAGTTKVRCSINGKSKKYSKTFTVKVKKAKKSASKISRVGKKVRRVEVDDDFELKVKKSKGLSERHLKWSINNRSIVDFDDDDRTDDEIELEARKVGKTTITCKNTKTGKSITYIIHVVRDNDDDDDDDDD